MTRLVLLASIMLTMAANSLFAREISVFAVNFGEQSLKTVLINELNKRLDQEDVIIGVLDAERVGFVGFFSSAHPVFGDDGALSGIKSEVSNRFGLSKKPVNLPLILSEVNEFILGNYQEGDTVNIYLVDILEHSGRNFSFESGFPNDGFLTLDDSDFSLVRGLPESFNTSVYVLQLTANTFRDQYLRFVYHLSPRILGGRLTSFAFASSAPALSFEEEPITVALTDLETVSASRVTNAETRPVCEVEDLVQVVRKAERLDVSVQSVSRANSLGNYELTVGSISDVGQFSFDSSGNASFSVKRIPGEGILKVSDCAGAMQEHFSYDTDELNDVISVTGVAVDIANISGQNVQRIDDSDVVIVDENTGRRWITQVTDGRYSIEVPVAPGKHIFYVERPFSKEKQYFTVFLQEHCNLNSDLSYDGAIGRLKIQSTCSTQKELVLSYDGNDYRELFDGSQEAKAEFLLTCGTSYGTWRVDQGPEHEFVVQYTINPDQVSVAEGNTNISIAITNPSRANSTAKYQAILGSETFAGTISFNGDGMATAELPRTSPGGGVFHLENCQGNMVQAGSYKVSKIDDEINVSVLSDTKARIVGENIQRPNGSRVTIGNEDTDEQWTAVVQNGHYSIEVPVPHGLQNFTASKPNSSDVYRFTVKVREPCKAQHRLDTDSGLGLLFVMSECKLKSRIAQLNYGGISYTETLNSDKVAIFQFPLECGPATGTWILDTEDQTFSTDLDCNNLIRVIVRFEKPANLNLHVKEDNPPGRNGGTVGFDNCNYSGGLDGSPCNGVGKLMIDLATQFHTINQQYYEARISDFDNTKRLRAMVEFHDRNLEYGKDIPSHLCGTADLAQIPYTISFFDGKSWTVRKRIIDPLPCGIKVPYRVYENKRNEAITIRR